MGLRKPHFHVRLTNQVKLDLEIWLKFLQDFNGKSLFLDDNTGPCMEKSGFMVCGPWRGIH